MGSLVTRGTEAARILDSDAFKETVALVRRGLVDRWVATPAGDEHRDARESLHMQYSLLDELVSKLRAVAATGKRAAVVLEESDG